MRTPPNPESVLLVTHCRSSPLTHTKHKHTHTHSPSCYGPARCYLTYRYSFVTVSTSVSLLPSLSRSVCLSASVYLFLCFASKQQVTSFDSLLTSFPLCKSFYCFLEVSCTKRECKHTEMHTNTHDTSKLLTGPMWTFYEMLQKSQQCQQI